MTSGQAPARNLEGVLELLIVQPTPFCNLACDYCYLLDKSDKTRMRDEVLEATMRTVLDSRFPQQEFTIVWHAGEPLVVGVPYYENAFQMVERLDGGRYNPKHSFQTNATLINDDWCDLMKRWSVDVGVSIDGPAFLHDAHRVTRSGRPTHERVMQGVKCLQDNDVDFHVISVITAEGLDHPEALFEFYKENGIRRVGINMEESEGANPESSLSANEQQDKVQAFWRRLLELVLHDDEHIYVREFDGLGGFILRGDGGIGKRCQESDPFRIINVDVNGNYSTFSPELVGVPTELYEGSFDLGNVMTDPLDEALASPKLAAMQSDIAAGVRLCRETCSYFNVCGGGNASNKYFENGTFASSETASCRLSKMALVEAMVGHFEKALGLEAQEARA